MLYRLRAVLAAVPDLVTSGAFLFAWLHPLSHAGLGKNLLVVMLVEFLVVHSAGMLGSMIFKEGEKRDRIKAVLGFSVLYLIMVGGFAAGFKAWWPVFWFLWLIFSKVMIIIGGDTGPDRANVMRREWAFSAIAYLIAVAITTLLPIPELGLDSAARQQWALPGSGLWIEKPQTVIAAGFGYFFARAVFRYFSTPKAPAP